MARSIARTIETRKNRLKRRSGKIFSEIMKSVSLVAVIGTMALVMVYVYNVVITTSFFALKDVSVGGVERVTEEEIVRLAGVDSDSNILTLNVKEIIRNIESHPWVENVSVGRELPNRLVIQIVERRPEALVVVDGNIHIVDSRGNVFKEQEKDDEVSLPVLNGFCEGGEINRDLLKKSLPLLRFLANRSTFPGRDHVAEIYGDEMYGFTIFMQGGLSLAVGFENYDRKFRRLNPVLHDLARRDCGKGTVYIDLTDCNKVVVMNNPLLRPRHSREGYSA